MRAATDYPYYYPEAARDLLDIPRAWSERGNSGLGEFKLNTLWAWPQNFTIGLFSNLGLDYSIIIFLILASAFTLAFFSSYKLLQSLEVNKKGRIAGALFYSLNTYFLLLIDGGQIGIALAYAILPFAFLLSYRSVFGKIIQKIKAGFIISLLGFFDFRFIYLFFMLISLKFAYEYLFIKKYLTKFLLSLLVWSLVIVLLHAYWIIPLALVKETGVDQTYFSNSQLASLSFANFKHAIFFFQPHWYKNVFGQISRVDKNFLILPFFVFLLPAFALSREKLFWLITSIISILLVVGANSPVGFLYEYAFSYVPGFSLFRDPTKFYTLLAISYSELIGFTFHKLNKYFVLIFVVYLSFLIRPVYLGRMTGMLGTHPHQESYLLSSRHFRESGRILWVPIRPPLGYSSPNNTVVELKDLISRRPFAVGVFGNYETSNFLREAGHVGDLLDIANIAYIAYPFYDDRREDIGTDKLQYYHYFSKQIENQDYIKEKINNYPVNIYKTNVESQKFFVTDETFYVHGSDSVYENFSSDELSLKNNALVFTSEQADENYIFLSDYLTSEPDRTGFWKRDSSDFLWVRDFLQQKYEIDNQDFTYGGGYAFAEGEAEITISDDDFDKKDTLYLRTLQSTLGNKISVSQDGVLIGEINTKLQDPKKVIKKISGFGNIQDQVFEYTDSEFVWQEVGELVYKDKITVNTSGKLNIVNAISSAKKDTITANGKAESYEFSTQKSPANIEYTKINPTHYKVKITNLDKPSTLVFSESFDSKWELDGQPSYKVYSLLNGFWITENGEYEIYFEPQKHVNFGIKISLISALSFIFYILKYGKNNKASRD